MRLRLGCLILMLWGSLLGESARAGVEAMVLTGARRVHMGQLSGQPGSGQTWGPDVGASLLFRIPKSSVSIGAAYRENFFNPQPGASYFEQVRMRELAIEGSLSVYEKGLFPEISVSYTPTGALVGKTINPLILDPPGSGAMATQGESTWTYRLTGIKTRIGLSYNLDAASNLFMGMDLGQHEARLQTVSIRGNDESERAKRVSKSPVSLTSYSVLFGLRVGV